MDLVLILKHSDAAQDLYFFSQRGLSQLARLSSWLVAQGSPSNQYIVVPRGQPALVPLLPEFVGGCGSPASCGPRTMYVIGVTRLHV